MSECFSREWRGGSRNGMLRNHPARLVPRLAAPPNLGGESAQSNLLSYSKRLSFSDLVVGAFHDVIACLKRAHDFDEIPIGHAFADVDPFGNSAFVADHEGS